MVEGAPRSLAALGLLPVYIWSRRRSLTLVRSAHLNPQRKLLRPIVAIAAVCLCSYSLRGDDLDEHALDPVAIVGGNIGGTPTFGAAIVFGREKDKLYLVTANHVVRSGGMAVTDLTVRLRTAPGKNLSATLLPQFDPALDVAVLSVDHLAAQGINVCSFSLDHLAPPGAAKRGDPVFPVGNPNGVAWSMPVRPDAISDVSDNDIVFQSTLIGRGHSGGALISGSGGLLGMIQADEPPYGRALNIAKVLQVLKAWRYSVDLNVPDETGHPLLLNAVFGGSIEQVRRLLGQTCADPNVRAQEGEIPLELAAESGSVEMVKLLIDAGANLKDKGVSGSMAESAAQGGNAEILRLLLSRGAPCCGRALSIAAGNGNLEIVKTLLAKDVDPNARQDSGTALFAALLPSRRSKRSASPEDLLPLLIQAGADVNAVDSDGDTPLLLAVEAYRPAAVKLLLAAGARTNVRGRYSKTVFGLAANEYADAEMHELAAMLVSASASLDPEDGAALLDRAAMRDWTDVAGPLLKHGVSTRGEAGGKALRDATLYQHVGMVKLLLDAGADADAKPLTPTPLQSALGYGFEPHDAPNDPASRLEMVKLLVSKGATVRFKDEILDPLSRSLFYLKPPDFDIAGFLIVHGADVNSGLRAARRRNEPEIVNFLLKHGARETTRP